MFYNHNAIVGHMRSLGLMGITHLGVIHWDFNLFAIDHKTSRITENIQRILDSGYDFITFFPGNFGHIITHYNVLMDERKPNCLFVGESGLNSPVSANDIIFNYVSHNLGLVEKSMFICPSMFNQYIPITLCCAGMFPMEWFQHVKMFMEYLITDINIERKFDTQKRHRFPGQLMERFVAIDSMFRKKFLFKLDHKFTGGLELKKSDPNGENY